jgi:hypothetical protein
MQETTIASTTEGEELLHSTTRGEKLLHSTTGGEELVFFLSTEISVLRIAILICSSSFEKDWFD